MSESEKTGAEGQNSKIEKPAKFQDIQDIARVLGIRMFGKGYTNLYKEFHKLLLRTQPRPNDAQIHNFLQSIMDDIRKISIPESQMQDTSISEIARSAKSKIEEVVSLLFHPSRTIEAYKNGTPLVVRKIPEKNTLNLEQLYTDYMHAIDPNREILPPLPKELQTVGTWVKVNRWNDQGTETVQLAEPIDYNEGMQFRYAEGHSISMAEAIVSGWHKNAEGDYTIYFYYHPSVNQIHKVTRMAEELRLKVVSAPDKNRHA